AGWTATGWTSLGPGRAAAAARLRLSAAPAAIRSELPAGDVPAPRLRLSRVGTDYGGRRCRRPRGRERTDEPVFGLAQRWRVWECRLGPGRRPLGWGSGRSGLCRPGELGHIRRPDGSGLRRQWDLGYLWRRSVLMERHQQQRRQLGHWGRL